MKSEVGTRMTEDPSSLFELRRGMQKAVVSYLLSVIRTP